MAKYLAIISAAISLFAFVDCAMRDETLIKKLPKWAWLLIIFFLGIFGSVFYLFAGRNGKFQRSGLKNKSKKPRILPPDDDPDFLNKL
jgi:hypothetical protein